MNRHGKTILSYQDRFRDNRTAPHDSLRPFITGSSKLTQPASIDQLSNISESLRCDVVHVGMPKCGSSFLQQVGFARHPEIALVWEPGIKLFFEFRDRIDSPGFDLEEYSRRLAEYVNEKTSKAAPEAKVVFSFEGFCGPQVTNRNDHLLAKRLRQLVGPAKLVFVVREQYQLLFSIWGQYIKEGGTMSLKRFLTHPDSPASPQNENENIFRRVQYAEYLSLLFELFGRDRVGVFFFEDFVSNYGAFIRRLYEFIGVDGEQVPQNSVIWRGPNFPNANLFRMLNRCSTTKRGPGLLPFKFYQWYRRLFARHVFPSKRLNRSWKPDTKRYLSEKVQEQIAESNRKLADMTNRDLTELGYST